MCAQTLPFVPCLAGVLPRLQLCVRKGQQGQHGDGKEGRLCPARPPGRPEGEGAWRAVKQRKRVSGKKRRFPSSFSPSVLSSSPFFLHSLSLSAVARISLQFSGGGWGSARVRLSAHRSKQWAFGRPNPTCFCICLFFVTEIYYMPHFAVSGVCLMQRKLIKFPGRRG